jgi:putative peptidoglycan lipid II flippase
MRNLEKNKTSFFLGGFSQSAFLTTLSRISGYIRDVFIATFLGAGIFSDIFFISFKLPYLFRRITAEGALTSSFLPIYAKLRSQNSDFVAIKYFKKIIYKVTLMLILLMIIFQIFMPIVVSFIAPGFTDNSEVINQIISLTRITMIFMPLISAVALLGVATNVSGRFWILSFTPIILNSFIILGCLSINDSWTIKSLPLGMAMVIGGVFQLIFMIAMIKKYKILNSKKIKKQVGTKNDESVINFHIKQTWRRFFPAAFGGGILQINLLVDTILGSLLGFGAVSYLYFADRVTQLPLGIIGVALGTSLLTSLSRASAQNEIKQFSKELIISFKIGLFFSIPAAFVFIFYNDLLIKVLFERGEFTFNETKQTSIALFAYSLGIPAFIMMKSCQPAFLATGNTKTPMYIGFILLILNIILSFILMSLLNHAGIALATSIVSWIGTTIYITILVKNGKITKPKISFKQEDSNFFVVIFYGFKITLVSILMIIGMKLFQYTLEIFNLNETLILIILCVIGFFMYLLMSLIFKYIPQELYDFIYLKFKKAK